MFRELRNQSKRIDHVEVERILLSQTYGTLATIDANGYAYASPSMFVYRDNSIFLHSANKGQKLENIRLNPCVSFCVVEEFLPAADAAEKEYRSVIAFGKVRILDDNDERMAVFIALCRKFNMMFKLDDPEYIRKRNASTEVLQIEIEHITGKKL